MTTNRPVALVTGASSGIGKAVAIALAGASYEVIRTAATPREVAAHAGVTYLDLDVTSDESVASVVEQVIHQFGASTSWSTTPASARRRRRGKFRRPGPGRLRRQRLRRHPDDQGGPAAHARSPKRTHHQRLLRPRVPSRPLHGHLRLDQARDRGTRSRWTTRSASTASDVLVEPARSRPGSTPTPCRPTPHCRYTRQSGGPSRGADEGEKDGDDPAIVAKVIVAAATDPNPKLRLTVGPAIGRVCDLTPSPTCARTFDRQIRKLK